MTRSLQGILESALFEVSGFLFSLAFFKLFSDFCYVRVWRCGLFGILLFVVFQCVKCATKAKFPTRSIDILNQQSCVSRIRS